MSEREISSINSILSIGEFEYYNNENNQVMINKQSLVEEIIKYRNTILLTAYLEQKQMHLNNIKEYENRK
jgi:hypothetical protein